MQTITYRSASVHCHSTYCDGKNTPAEMVAAAAELGVQTFGFSGHSLSFEDSPCGMNAAEFAAYTAEVAALKTQWAGKVDVLYGIEWDLYSCYLPTATAPVVGGAYPAGEPLRSAMLAANLATQPKPPLDLALQSIDSSHHLLDNICPAPNLPFDYWVGSVHSLRDPLTGLYYTVDWNADMLTDCIRDVYDGDVYAMVEGYFAAVEEMASYRPTILGHFDLIKKLNGDGQFFDETHPRYLAAAKKALVAARKNHCVLEINTGGVFRGYRTDFYPSQYLLSQWQQMGGQVTITADTHSADSILFAYDEAAQSAKQAGFCAVQVLTKNGFVACDL